LINKENNRPLANWIFGWVKARNFRSNPAFFGPTLANRTYSLKNSRFCCPTGRGDPFKIFLAKPLRRKAYFELLNVPNWMQMAYFEPPKIEGITPARRTGDAIST
jgi:hypothetical protein